MRPEQARENMRFEPEAATANVADIAEQLRGILARAGADGPTGGIAGLDRELETLIGKLQSAARAGEKKLADQNRRITHLEQISTTDELTGILNRHGFEEEFRRVLARAHRHGEEGVLVYVDLDGFKPINDTHGHAAGDEVLRQVGRILVENVRGSDSVARIGGDEFCVLLVNTSRLEGTERTEALNRVLNRAVISWNERQIAIRASFGLQAFTARDNAKELLCCADAAMYRIKRFKETNEQLRHLPVHHSLGNIHPIMRLSHAD